MRLLHLTLFISMWLLTPLRATEAGFSYDWNEDAQNRAIVGASDVDTEYTICRLSVVGGMYFPGEAVRLSLLRPDKPKRSAAGGAIEVVAFTSALHDPSENGFVHPKGASRIARVASIPVAVTPLSGFTIEKDEWHGTVQVPDAFGMYALLVRHDDGVRSLIGTIARVPKPQARLGRFRQVMAEWRLPGGHRWAPAHPDSNTAAALARAGIGLVRKEIQSGLASEGDDASGAGSYLDGMMAACRANGIQVMITAGCHQDQPLKDAGIAITRQLPPEFDAGLTRWYAGFAKRHWSGGDSGLWAIEHFNEPWEPIGISGWNSDSQRYRQLLKCLYDGVKSVDKRILVAGTSSVMNTEDKLLSGDSREHMKMLDMMTDHYVSIFAAYGPRVAEKHGIVSGETETWGAHNMVLAAQFMCQFLSNGQKWINPMKESAMFTSAPGLDRDLKVQSDEQEYKLGVIVPTPTLVALAVWNATIRDREFKRLAFTGHLPYLYQFGDDADARLVLCGRVTSTGSGRMADYPWHQVLEGPTGIITIPDPQRAIEATDLNGNPLPRQADGSYRMPFDTTSYYLWSAKGAGTVIEAVRASVVEGVRAVHIAPNGVRPSANGATILPVGLHNALNRTVGGTLTITSLSPQVKLEFSRSVELPAGSNQTVEVPLPSTVASGLPLRFTYAPAGLESTSITEVVQTTVISKATPANAKAWANLPGATVIRPQGEVKGSEIEAIWLPFVQKQQVSVPTRRGEVKLAWDDKALHISATVDAAGIRKRPRLATRNDDKYFYSDAFIEETYGPLRPYLNFIGVRGDGKIWAGGDRHWVMASGEPGWQEYQEFLKANPKMKNLIDNGSAKRWAESKGGSVKHLSYVYLPDSPMIDHLPFQGDSFQFAIDVDRPEEVMRKTHDLTYPADAMPKYWTAVPDSDYEFGLYLCDDGKPELWCLMAPGVPRGHYFCRQERGKINQHAVAADCSVVNADGRTTYRASIPWSALGGAPWPVGSDVGFTFSFNAADGGNVGFGYGGATKMNSLTMHPYWLAKPSNTIRWTVLP